MQRDKKNMNKQELIARIADRAGLTKAQAADALDATVGAIGEALKAGDDVRLVGFGTFMVSRRPAREMLIPGTREKKMVPATNAPRFKPGKGLKDLVNS